MCLTLTHMRSITERWAHAVDYVESMLRKSFRRDNPCGTNPFKGSNKLRLY